MDHNEMMNHARKMFLANKGRRDVITFFQLQGVPQFEAESMATEAYKSIREVRQAMIEEAQNNSGGNNYAQPTSSSGSNGGAIISIVLGLIICGGGLAASMGTNTIFYGAVLVGGGMFLKGIIELAA